MTAVLDRGWRLLVTAVSFALFGIAGVLLGALVMPLLWLLVRRQQSRRKAARWLITRGFRAFVGIMAGLGGLSYKIGGMETVGNTPQQRRQRLQRCLIVANHPSLIDVVFLLAWFPEAVCIVKGDHWYNPVFTGSIRNAGYISNSDPLSMLLSAQQHLEQGEHVIMFPEGTRTVPGKPMDLKRGAATLAVNAGARVLPVVIRCTPTTLTKAQPWYHIPRRQVLIEMDVLAAISAQQVHPEGLSPRQAALDLTNRLSQIFSQHGADG